MLETGARYLSRALDFIHSAEVLCKTVNQGCLPSACLLIGMDCELIAKKQLLEMGEQASVPRISSRTRVSKHVRPARI